ncbi:M6 family metalloprotease domain-containing protein, partial [Bacteroidales bacterium OttesenSCG-928-I14]|nr:M6 family metalloprotease domain-containing protein [Bacteroidales bacterium OttesenSCG-928-I14]
TSSFKHDYYESRSQELVMEAARKAFKEENINPEDYDNDKDFYIDTFHLIFAGYGAESTGRGKGNIWSHKSSVPQTQFGNVWLTTYSCSPELRGYSGTNLTYIGVICHELCHVFGAPDFYDTNGSTGGEYDGTGSWDLMANGSWNANGSVPAHINMYQKINFGWVKAKTLTEPEAIIDMPNSAENSVAYIVQTGKNNDYYVLENRQKVGYDAYVPGTGLLIYHVNISNLHIRNNNPNATHPQRVYPVNAGATYSVPSASASSYYVDSNRTPFGKTSNKSEFTETSTPQMFSWNGSNGLPVADKPITEIREEDKKISFLFGNAKYPFVIDLKAGVKDDQIAIRWSHEEPATPIKHYKVFKNRKHILDTNETMYVEIVPWVGNYRFGVCAVFEDDTESETVEIIAEVTVASIDDYKTNTFSVYPNPVNGGGEFFINLGESASSAQVQIFDLSGRLLFSETTQEQVTPFNLPLTPGTYLVKIINEDFSETKKLTIR